MGEEIQQCVALHCFNNLVEFMIVHKFKTDWKSVSWRKMIMNICLSSIDEIHLKNSNLSAAFNLNYRTCKEYITGLPVNKIKFLQAKVKQGSSWDKREGGTQLINMMCRGYWADHLTTSSKKNNI